jgi:hypothetical protein
MALVNRSSFIHFPILSYARQDGEDKSKAEERAV